MITAVDSSVLIDIFGADGTFGARSANLLRRCLSDGSVIACEIVWTETALAFEEEHTFVRAMETLSINFSPIAQTTALVSARAWRKYLARGGRHKRVVADFLVGAHALEQADRLLTRDRGFYRDYFVKLRVLDPQSSTQ